ncbi:Crp/Fnr family transcriptional regulator [Anianabacter salinae]|uniref:Crp/Fnr family transcriptional regulator n=1 Tax=Anianabacter salinae TaxID=2851023 RepID=UPI00225DD10B|nr:Crp/Fnr family transcriptional regulator [Anianabacter salinae]MBV0912922.1 Crp/Fnr family transcriptional regulator [Anianabacter salinae]
MFTQGFLTSAPEALRASLKTLANEVRLAENEVLFEQGDEGDALYSVISGTLEISVLSEEGKKLTLDIMREGSVLGEISLFDPGERTATVTATEPTRLYRIRNPDLTAAIRREPDIALGLIRLAGQRMRWMNAQMSDQVFLPMPTRLARRLLYLTQHGTNRLSMSQAEVAEFTGATREAVSRVLNDWKAAGVIEVSRGGLAILDREALETLAETGGV